jgi:magnesium chelatase subunit D
MARIEYPFAAVSGMEEAKLALQLLAVDPGLKGVLIAGGAGIAKSVLARSLRPLLSRNGNGVPFVEVPAGITEDRLLGGMELEAALLHGIRRLARGVLAQAHGGILFVDEINLLSGSLRCQIADVLNSGVVRVERDGVGDAFRSEFAIVAAYDPGEGEFRGSLADSIGLHVLDIGSLPAEERARVMSHALAFDTDPAGFADRYADATALLRACIHAGRARLPGVRIAAAHERSLARAALQLGIEGHRGEIFARRAARAHAALAGRDRVEPPDIEAAIRFVLLPRATSRPAAAGEQAHEEPRRVPAEDRASMRAGAEQILPPVDGRVPDGLLVASAGRGLPGGRTARSKTAETVSPRGRFVRAVIDRPNHGKVAIEATLRAAAPFQRERRARGTAIRLTPADLRFKQFKQRTGLLVIFAIDASGSMAFNRIQQAKGAIIRMLQECYLHRDTVALAGFRNGRAEVLLEPTRSVELAQRALNALPVGGGTPLAAGLLAALGLARRTPRRALLVLLTDGRANVPCGDEAVWTEIHRVCAALKSENVSSVVIDTNRRPAGRDAERLAALLGGRYVALPGMPAGPLYDCVTALASTLR